MSSKYQHGKVAPAAQAVEVYRLVGRGTGHHLDPCLDRRIDVDVVALHLAVVAIETHTQSSERPTQPVGVRQIRERCRRLRRAAAPPARCTSSAGSAVGERPTRGNWFPRCAVRRRRIVVAAGRVENNEAGAAPRARAGPVRRRVGAGWTALAELAHHSQHLLEQPAPTPPRRRPGWRRRPLASSASSFSSSCEFGQRLVTLPAGDVLTGRLRVSARFFGLPTGFARGWLRKSSGGSAIICPALRAKRAMRRANRVARRCRSRSATARRGGKGSRLPPGRGGPRPRDNAWPERAPGEPAR